MHVHYQQDGNTALHLATKGGRVNCARAILIHPGTDPNIKNNEGLACLDTMKDGFSALHKMVDIYNSVPVASYGRVVVCGNSGAGKSTMSQVSRQGNACTCCWPASIFV